MQTWFKLGAGTSNIFQVIVALLLAHAALSSAKSTSTVRDYITCMCNHYLCVGGMWEVCVCRGVCNNVNTSKKVTQLVFIHL